MIDAQAVEIRADGQCLLTAHWSISTGSGGPVLRKERDSFVEREADTGDAAIAASVSRAIDRPESRIAVTIPGEDHRHAGASKHRSQRQRDRRTLVKRRIDGLRKCLPNGVLKGPKF